jgi:hypothetical protein
MGWSMTFLPTCAGGWMPSRPVDMKGEESEIVDVGAAVKCCEAEPEMPRYQGRLHITCEGQGSASAVALCGAPTGPTVAWQPAGE